MSIYDSKPRKTYAVGTTAQAAFAVPFVFWKATDLRVYVGDVLQASGYTVTGGDGAGGTVTLATPVSNTTVAIVRRMKIERTTDFPAAGALKTAALNRQLDQNTAILQQLDDDNARSLMLPENDDALGSPLPPLAQRANRVLGFDAAGKPIVSTISIQQMDALTIAALQAGKVAEVIEPFEADGATSTITTTAPLVAAAQVTLLIGGIIQRPESGAYTVSGTTITLAEPPPAGVVVGGFVGYATEVAGDALTAIQGTAPAADRLPYFTGDKTASTTALTAFARTLLGGASPAAVRALLGALATDGDASGTTFLPVYALFSRTLADAALDEVNVMSFIPAAERAAIRAGASTYDCTAAIQAAIAAAFGKRLRIPKGRYLVSATAGTEIFLLDRQIKIHGDGAAVGQSEIVVSSAVPNTIDVFRISPQLNNSVYSSFFWGIEDLRITPQSGTPARHGVHIDLGVSQFLARFSFLRNYVGAFGGYCFQQDKNTSSDVDGFFSSCIEDNFFNGGGGCLRLNNSGDSLKVLKNTITGAGIGVYTKPVGGAAHQIFAYNNVTAAGGAFVVENGDQVKILYNQCEQNQAYTGSKDAMVALTACNGCDVIGNNLNTHDRVSCIRIEAGGTINRAQDNTMAVSATASKYHFVLASDAGAMQDFGGRNRWVTDGADSYFPRVSDGTAYAHIGVWRSVTLANSWVVGSDPNFTQGIDCKVNPDRSVSLRGTVQGGTNAAGTTIATLPVGARPSRAMRIDCHVLNGSAWADWTLTVDTSGNIKIPFQTLPATTLVSFDSVRFDTY